MHHERITGPIDGAMNVVEEAVSFSSLFDGASSNDVLVHCLQHACEVAESLFCGNDLALDCHFAV